MRYLMIWRPAKNPTRAQPMDEAHMAEMGRLIAELSKAGVLLHTGAVSGPTARVRREGDDYTVLDGALPELAAEPLVGYAIMRYATREEAIAGAKRFLSIAGEGHSEVLPLMEDA